MVEDGQMGNAPSTQGTGDVDTEGTVTQDAAVPQATLGPHRGLGSGADPGWVPERSTEQPLTEPATRHVQVDRSQAEDRAGEARRLRVRRWHVVSVVALVAGMLLVAVVWVVNSLDGRSGSVPGPVVGLPLATTEGPSRGTEGTVPSVSATGHPADPPQPNRTVFSPPPMPSPPALIGVPTITVTAVPKRARTIRFEAHAERGSLIEVSISDATHRRHDFPTLAAPVAFEMPVPPGTPSSSSSYYVMRVSVPARRAGSPVDVYCRILVDGIVITSRQGQEYVSCDISPYYDIHRS